ncbi:DUF4249 domain-containing protein [Daejeonella sp. JGW-45]|uniref:DUF4249 domain-containing protein n=1 Tax=Daejeonella sp. JGW-45 TaxID=3034148 RepID=UPI0023EB4CC3|nr:DUF4249 domain-containing protein [Daejeonella sp. JGW-45]
MIRKLLILSLFSTLLTSPGCRKPFNPETIKGFSSALIVEGVINPSGVTNIYLSRTLDLDDKVAVKAELKASVQVLAENNAAFTLTEKGNGLYSIPQLSLNSAQKYRLKIKTAAGAEYMSDPMGVKNTPLIDNLAWVREPGGVGIYVDAHDSQNNTRYYQWDYEEDWELRSLDESLYKGMPLSNGKGSVVSRDPKETPLMLTCYKSGRSTNIDIFSTAPLTSDVVSKHRVVFIPDNSEKLAVRYSVLVRQYALPFEAFEYLSMMKRNSEQLGSFFDAQPSELIGNIRNINDPKDIAIGFIGIASVQEKRIFIERNELQSWGFRLSCVNPIVKNNADSLVAFNSGQLIPRTPIISAGGGIEAWEGLSINCMDCRSRGGNNNKPAFW